MSILIRCVQFGRRHLWPHLLLGVVAAGVSSASTVNEARPESPANPAISRSALPAIPNSAVRLRNELIAPATPPVVLRVSISQPEQASVQDWRPVAGFFARLAQILAPHTPHAGPYAGVWWPEAPVELSAEPVRVADTPPLQQPAYSVLLSPVLRLQLPVPAFRLQQEVTPAAVTAYLPSRWLAQVQGIRAGPLGWA
ncbi:MAG: hypothetical protein ACRCR6_05625 [Plesiomonas sp.]